jgi:hypothetical protein
MRSRIRYKLSSWHDPSDRIGRRATVRPGAFDPAQPVAHLNQAAVGVEHVGAGELPAVDINLNLPPDPDGHAGYSSRRWKRW